MEEACINRLNKKQKIEDMVAAIFQENGMSYEQGIEYCKATTRKFSIDWLSVFCSDWLSALLLQYLKINDITRLDSALCNRSGREQWLNSLEKHFPSNCFGGSIDWSDYVVNWIVARKLRFDCLEIFNGFFRISNDCLYRLAKQCHRVKKLVLSNSVGENSANDKNLQHLIALCYKLESITLRGFSLSRNECIWLGA